MLSYGYKNKTRSNSKANEMKKKQYNLFIKRICFSHRYRSIVQDDEIISGKQFRLFPRYVGYRYIILVALFDYAKFNNLN